MTRVLIAALLAASLWAQKPEPQKPPQDKPAKDESAAKPAEKAEPVYAEPEEEDTAEKTRVIEFNPIEAEKDITTGKFYMKKGTPSGLKAALARFDSATKYNPQSAEAWLRLGEVREKVKDKKGARAAYEKYLELEPKASNAGEIHKRLSKLN